MENHNNDIEKPEKEPVPAHINQDDQPIPFFNQKKPKEPKQGYKFGIFSFLVFLIVIIVLPFLVPLYPIIMYYTPDSVQEKVLWPLFRNIPLYTEPHQFDEPEKISIPDPGTLPVLGFDTGICFSFLSSLNEPNPEYIDEERLKEASRGKKIAEIIALEEKDKYEYQLESTIFKEKTDDKGKTTTIICQKFGRSYASTPKKITSLYIRPLAPFKAEKTVWNSVKHLYDEYTSPLEPGETHSQFKIIP